MRKPVGKQWPRIVAARKDPPTEQTNRYFAKHNEKFIEACIETGVKATARQASKYRNKKGRAYASTIQTK